MKVSDFSGITINTGIDAHLKQWNASVYIENKHFKTFQQPPDPVTLSNYLQRTFPNGTYKSAYEAGYFGFTAHRKLCSLGIENIVINACDIPTSDKERKRKNDTVDSKKIARSLINGELVGIYVPSCKQQADRSLVRYRISKCRKSLTRIKQQIKSFLAQQGIRYYEMSGNQHWSGQFINQIKELQFEASSDQFIRDRLIAKYEWVVEQRRIVDRQIVKLSQTAPYSELVKRLRTIPGVGLLTAMVLVTEIIDMKRFSSLDSLCCYFGIVPDTQKSDQKEKVRGITRRVNKDVRRIIVQAAWVAAGKSHNLAMQYHHWVKKKKIMPQKAVIKLTRKLLSISRALWLNGTNYQPQSVITESVEIDK